MKKILLSQFMAIAILYPLTNVCSSDPSLNIEEMSSQIKTGIDTLELIRKLNK